MLTIQVLFKARIICFKYTRINRVREETKIEREGGKNLERKDRLYKI